MWRDGRNLVVCLFFAQSIMAVKSGRESIRSMQTTANAVNNNDNSNNNNNKYFCFKCEFNCDINTKTTFTYISTKRTLRVVFYHKNIISQTITIHTHPLSLCFGFLSSFPTGLRWCSSQNRQKNDSEKGENYRERVKHEAVIGDGDVFP